MEQESRDNIRQATNLDIPAILLLVETVLNEYGLPIDLPGTDADLSDIEKNYILNKGMFYVVEGEHGIIGTAGLFPLDDTSCELRKMYLYRPHRGRGTGSRLLKMLLQHARMRGYTYVILETASVLKEAIALYTSHGFEPFIPAHMSSRCNLAYRLSLQPGKSTSKGPGAHRS